VSIKGPVGAEGRPNKRWRLIGGILILGILVFGTVGWAATPIYVDAGRPDDSGDGTSWATAKKTIQAGIGVVDIGGTVHVAAGTYEENVDIDKSLTLQGVDRDTTIINGKVTTAADNVEFTGFTVTGMLQAGDMCAWYSGVVISNNILKTIHGAACHGLIIQNNVINGDASQGISLDACDGTSITGNTITGFQNGPHAGYNHGWSGAAVYIYSRCDGTEVINNDLKDNSVGVYLATVTTMDTPANVEVHSNNIEGNGDYGVCNFRFPPGMKDPGTEENLNYWDYDDFSPANNDADATGNWWGTVNGPEHSGNTFNVGSQGDKVSDNVTYVPWLDAAYPGGISWGPVYNPSASYYSSIQAAVDAASTTDTITCAAGTYNESVTINKNNLTIQGPSNPTASITGGLKFDTDLTGLTFKNFNVTGNAVAGKNSVVRMYGAITGLTVDNCVFDGENVSDRMGFTGGQIEGDLTVINSEFKNILGWAVFDTRSGSGGDGSAMGTVTFANNNVHDCNGSVVFRGLSTDWTDNVYIYGNIFQDIGEAGVSKHWAAFEVNRANNVEIYDNEIRNVVQSLWGEGQAMQLWKVGTVDIYANTIENNYMGIAFLKWPAAETYDISGISIYYNNFSGNNQYALSVEDGLTGSPLNAENNWWGNATGPTHAGNPGGTGDAVSDNVDFDPWLLEKNGTETSDTDTTTVTGSGTVTNTPTGGDVTIDGTGDHTITTAKYTENPGGTPTFKATGDYYDVHLDTDAGVNSLTIEFCPATPSTIIYYWDETSSSWQRASDQTYADGCIVVTITDSTSPSLSNLTGLPFGSSTVTLGDINDDGYVNVLDARLCLQIVTGFLTPTAAQRAAADVDGDGDVDRDDAELLAKYIIGMEEKLGGG